MRGLCRGGRHDRLLPWILFPIPRPLGFSSFLPTPPHPLDANPGEGKLSHPFRLWCCQISLNLHFPSAGDRYTNPEAKQGGRLLGGVSQVSPSPGQATSQVQDRRALTASPQAFPMSGQMAGGKRRWEGVPGPLLVLSPQVCG